MFVTKDRLYAVIGGLAILLVSAIAILFTIARNGAADAAKAEVAAATAPVIHLEARVDSVENGQKTLQQQMDQRIGEVKIEIAKVEGLVRTSETGIKQELQGTNQKIDNLTTLLLTGKVPVPAPAAPAQR